ncbi:D-alanyl-D-alanine carboxypeptidase, partial [bacterium]|nr:D-alanyl-D-alanine carboxypeptidase [bacterium]
MLSWWFLGLVLVISQWWPSFPLAHWAQNKIKDLSQPPSQIELKTFPLVKGEFPFRTPSALIVDLNSDYIVQEKAKDKQRPIASLTKLMTALVLTKQQKLEEVVTIPEEVLNLEGSKAYLEPKEKFKVKDLIKALLVRSANDAGLALQKHFRNSSFDLVEAMNEEAKALGLSHTHFEDATGLSEKNVSTAWELYQLTKEFLRYPFLRQIVASSKVSVCALSGHCDEFCNTNRLVREGFLGVKTGYTEEAGHCLIALKNIQASHPTIFIV